MGAENVKVVEDAQTRSGAEKFKQILKDYNLVILFLVFCTIAALLSDRFLTTRNFLNLLQQYSVLGIISMGMTFVIITGQIDLSVGSVAALSGMVVAVLLSNGYSLALSLALALLVGIIAGLTIGFIYTIFEIPSFILSLAMMVSARGLALLMTNGQPIFGLSGPFSFIGGGRLWGIPFSGIIWIVLTIIMGLLLKFSPQGRKLYAVGGNPEAAFFSGINVKLYRIMVFGISGFMAAIGGIVLASWLTVGQPSAGQGIELNAISAVVLGGTSLSGGNGGVYGTFFGVAILAIITNIFNLIGLASYYQYIFQGVIIALALVMNKLVVTGKSA